MLQQIPNFLDLESDSALNILSNKKSDGTLDILLNEK